MSDEADHWIALIRHGAPAMDPQVSSDRWGLSSEGRNCFNHPEAPILGPESAAAAAERMREAIQDLTALPAAVVSHGRIISAYLGSLIGIHGFRIWEALKMPDVLLVYPSARRVRRIGSTAGPYFAT